MEPAAGIKNIIFDLGGVLLDLDFTAPIQAFRELGAIDDNFDYRKAINDPLFTDFETGMIPPSRFREHIREMLGKLQPDDQTIDRAWCSMLGSVPAEKVQLLRELSDQYHLFLFSNTNAIHCAYFKNRFLSEHHFPIESLFEKAFYSHEIHDRKPMLSAFEKVKTMAAVEPGETLFVDDFPWNTEAASLMGFKVFSYTPGSDLTMIYRYLTE